MDDGTDLSLVDCDVGLNWSSIVCNFGTDWLSYEDMKRWDVGTGTFDCGFSADFDSIIFLHFWGPLRGLTNS